jgi:chloramphenicol O-acetyltransferase
VYRNANGTNTPIAVEHLMTYWSILEKVPGSKLRLTKMDDEIYEHFKKEFPDFDLNETIDEDSMKSKEGKDKWRNFINQYEKKIEDYNFGTILRSNPKYEYNHDTTIFGKLPVHLAYTVCGGLMDATAMRMQFYAIEIARYTVFPIIKLANR